MIRKSVIKTMTTITASRSVWESATG